MSSLARTVEGQALTRSHRRQQLALRAATLRDLALLWPLWEGIRIATFSRFVDIAAVLIGARHQESAALALQYYQRFRQAENVSGTATPRLAARLPMVDIVDNLRATGLTDALRASRAGQTIAQARRTGFVSASGSTGRMVLQGGTDTIISSTRTDEQALGWSRVTDADPCHFCAMLASRGPVFKTRATAGFEAHDHDACGAEPHYEGADWPGRAREFEDLWRRSTRGLGGNDARNAFRRAIEGRSFPDDPINQE